MVNCPSCGAVNNESAISCVACNRTLLLVCPQCSTRNKYSNSACEKCGRILKDKLNFNTGLKSGKDSVSDMYPSGDNEAPFSSIPQEPFAKVIIGVFIFTFLYMSQILAGYPIILLLAGLVSGILALWGLVDITFWVIEESDTKVQTPEDNMPDSFPLELSDGLSLAGETFASIDKEIESITELQSSKDTTDSSIPDENGDGGVSTKVSEKNTDSSNTRSEAKSQTLAEFLSEGIEHEVELIKNKIKRSPDNFALIMKLAQLHDERGEIDLAVDAMEKCTSFKPEVAEIYLYHGILLKKANKLVKAKTAFNKALSLNRFMSKAYYQLGTLARTKRELQPAQTYLQKCIQLAPDDAYAHYQLGMIYREMGELGLAQMELHRATLLHPTDSYGHSKLGQIYQLTNQLDQAVSEYSIALSLKPNDAFVLESLAEVVEAKGMHEKAVDLFQEALAHQFHPQVNTMLSLAKALRKLEAFEDLELLADEILRLEADCYDALFLKAISLVNLKKKIDAIELLEALSKRPDVSYEVWLELGKLYQGNGDTDKAVSALIRATTNMPDQAGIWNNIGILLSNQKAYEEALKAFKKAISFDYTDSMIQENLSAVQKKLESSCNRIIETRRKQLERDPEDLDAYLEMGRALELSQRPDEALMSYQRLLAINPEHVDGLLCYAKLLRKRGQLKMAVRCYREILKLRPEHMDAHIYLIQANLNMGFLNEALKHAVIAQKLDNEDSRVNFLLGKIYFAKGLAPRALKEFSLVAEKSSDPDMISWAELMRRRLLRNA